MPSYIRYTEKIGDQDVIILVEAPESTGGVVQASSGKGLNIADAKTKFTEALKDIKNQAQLLMQELDELPVAEAEIKFGLSTVGELGNLAIGKVGLGVNYEVTLKWKKPGADKGDDE